MSVGCISVVTKSRDLRQKDMPKQAANGTLTGQRMFAHCVECAHFVELHFDVHLHVLRVATRMLTLECM